jgi:hypothetical protein
MGDRQILRRIERRILKTSSRRASTGAGVDTLSRHHLQNLPAARRGACARHSTTAAGESL